MTTQLVDYGPYPRSFLYSEPPLESQPGLIESLQCYVERLASRYWIRRVNLDCAVKGVPHFAFNSIGTRYKRGAQCVSQDSPTRKSLVFANNLAKLTREDDVRYLGLGWLGHVITCADALRRHKAWCPACLLEIRQGRRPSYVPLIWSIKASETCLVHGCLLAHACNKCGAKYPRLGGVGDPLLNCPRCQSNLAQNTSAGTLTCGHLRATKEIATMLHVLRKRPAHELKTPNLRRVMESAKARKLCVGTNDFLAQAGVCKGSASKALNGKGGSLLLWVKVAIAADVSLAGLFCDDLWEEYSGADASPLRLDFAGRKPALTLPLDLIRRSIANQIAEGRPQRIGELAQEFKIDPSYLRVVLGGLTSELRQALKAAADRDFEHKVDLLAAGMQSILHTCGAKSSKRALSKQLRVPRTSRVFAAAHARVTASH